MLFRSDLCAKEKIKSSVESDHRQISRIAGHIWNELGEEERAPYKHLAQQEKERHARLYPGYKYAPVYRTRANRRKAKRDPEGEERRCKALADLLLQGVEGNELEVAAHQIDKVKASIPSHRRSSRRTVSRPSRARHTPASHISTATASRPISSKTKIDQDPASETISPSIVEESETTPEFPPVHRDLEVEQEAFVPTSEIPYLNLSDDSEKVSRSTWYGPLSISSFFFMCVQKPLVSSYTPLEKPTTLQSESLNIRRADVNTDDSVILTLCREDFESPSLPSLLSSPFSRLTSFSPSSESMYNFLHDSDSDSEVFRSPDFTESFISCTPAALQFDGSGFDNRVLGNSQISSGACYASSFTSDVDYSDWIIDETEDRNI